MYVSVIVLCHNSEGAPEFHTCTVEVTELEYADGIHYQGAKENAEHNGFVGPMVAFDASDPAGQQLGEMLAWLK